MTKNQARVAANLLCSAAAQLLIDASIDDGAADLLQKLCPGGSWNEELTFEAAKRALSAEIVACEGSN